MTAPTPTVAPDRPACCLDCDVSFVAIVPGEVCWCCRRPAVPGRLSDYCVHRVYLGGFGGCVDCRERQVARMVAVAPPGVAPGAFYPFG